MSGYVVEWGREGDSHKTKYLTLKDAKTHTEAAVLGREYFRQLYGERGGYLVSTVGAGKA